jgi:hypothetical protein
MALLEAEKYAKVGKAVGPVGVSLCDLFCARIAPDVRYWVWLAIIQHRQFRLNSSQENYSFPHPQNNKK